MKTKICRESCSETHFRRRSSAARTIRPSQPRVILNEAEGPYSLPISKPPQELSGRFRNLNRLAQAHSCELQRPGRIRRVTSGVSGYSAAADCRIASNLSEKMPWKPRLCLQMHRKPFEGIVKNQAKPLKREDLRAVRKTREVNSAAEVNCCLFKVKCRIG